MVRTNINGPIIDAHSVCGARGDRIKEGDDRVVAHSGAEAWCGARLCVVKRWRGGLFRDKHREGQHLRMLSAWGRVRGAGPTGRAFPQCPLPPRARSRATRTVSVSRRLPLILRDACSPLGSTSATALPLGIGAKPRFFRAQRRHRSGLRCLLLRCSQWPAVPNQLEDAAAMLAKTGLAGAENWIYERVFLSWMTRAHGYQFASLEDAPSLGSDAILRIASAACRPSHPAPARSGPPEC
jgi:hypothetical protein